MTHSEGTQIDRRTALKLLGGMGVAVGLGPRLRGPLPTWAATAKADAGEPLALTPSLVVVAARPADQLTLSFSLYNLVLNTSGPTPQLEFAVSGDPAYVVVKFPFQSLGEQVAQDPPPPPASPPPPWPSTPMQAIASEPTMLAFQVAPGVTSIPFTLDGLLGWTGTLTPQIETAATDAAPSSLQTAIVAPWNLYLSPQANGTWNHSTSPITYSNRTELWNTRLSVGGIEPPAATPQVLAVYTPGYPKAPPPDPFLMSLTPADRVALVGLSAGTDTAQPVSVNLLMLSPLGATLDLDGSWNQPAISDIVDWSHQMSFGRDTYVRVVEAGYLYPFGHRAVKITVTDREFQVSPNGDTVAYLVQKIYVEVTEPTIVFPGVAPEPYNGRANPLRTVTIKTKSTPPLDPDGSPGVDVPGTTVGEAIWPRSNGVDVPFHFVCSDWEGRKVEFSGGVIWVSETLAYTSAAITAVNSYYTSAANASRRSCDLGGQLMALAPTTGAKPSSTSLNIDSINLTATPVATPAPLTPGWSLTLGNAAVQFDGADQLAGSPQPPLPDGLATYPTQYLTNGFQVGIPEVFLEIAGLTSGLGPGLAFPTNFSGGLFAPNFYVEGMARDLGPVGDPTGLLAGNFTPSAFFSAALAAELLGSLPLSEVIASATGAAIEQQAPVIKTTYVYPANNISKPPTTLTTVFDWTPTVQADPANIFVPNGGAALTIHVKIITPLDGTGATTFTVDGQLVDFTLLLFGSVPIISVPFNKVHYTDKTGGKPNLEVDIAPMSFLGPLTFINVFEKLFASIGGPSVTADAKGVEVSYSLALPNISIGVFSLENLALGAQVTIPYFNGMPVRFRFNLSTRDNPFLLTVDGFAGGGFFAIAFGVDGIESIEVALEFGVSASLNLGVASGGVSITAGIYYELDVATAPATGNKITLTGFLQASGHLEVLGLVSISVCFYMGLTYLDPGKAYGEASLMVSIKVLFFKATVTLSVEKRIGGSGDPTFRQAISAADWNSYCAAFT